MTRATIYEVAQRCGVSTATVSRVMHEGTGFSPATRDKVLAAAAELGWVPSGPARGLAFGKTGIVGLLFPDLTGSGEAEEESPLFTDQVIRGAERAATSAGGAVLIAATRGANRRLAFSVAGQVDGLVILARGLPSADIRLLSRSVPVVVLANRSARTDVVGADSRGGSREVTRHLLSEHGITDLAFISGPARSPDSQERFAGFREALALAGLPVPGAPDADGGFTEAGGAVATRELLARREPPAAIVYGNDEMAIGGLGVLRRAGLAVPSRVAITGFDDIASTRHLSPPLTTVRQPMRELGQRAVELLLERIAEPGAGRRSVVLPTRLVVRQSCGCPDQSATAAPEGETR